MMSAILTTTDTPADNVSSDLEELKNQLIAWLQMPDWEASHTYLREHPRLLTERAARVLEQLKHAQAEENMRSLISHRQTLLHQARTWEIAGVYAYFQLAEQAATIDDHEREALLRQLQEWLAAPDGEQEQVYLEGHPSLLTRDAESLLAAWWLTLQQHEDQISIALHLQLLQHARTHGITAAYRRLPDAVSLNKEGREALREYWTNGEAEVLEQALECWQQALFLTLPDSLDRPMYLTNLGIGLRNRYERTGVRDDLERAIAISQQAVDAAPANSPNRPMYLNNLGIGLGDRYGHTGVLDDLERAIAIFQQAVDAASPNSPHLPSYLSNLGIGLGNLYRHTGVLDDLERAIAIFLQAVDAASPNSPDWSDYLTNLGLGLDDLYEYRGVLGDLERAIAFLQQAVDAAPADSPKRPTYLSNLGNELRNLYEHTGIPGDLEKAIAFLQQAVETASPNSPDGSDYLTNLGIGLRNRYERTGVQDDLEKAIAFLRQAVDAAPANSPDRPVYLSNLSDGLRDRYECKGALDDLEKAIAILRQAVDATPANSPDRPMYLSNLGTGLRNYYEYTGKLDDLKDAIAFLQQAVDATPDNSPKRPKYLSNLGIGLHSHYDCTGVLDDLESAITIFQQAVDVAPDDSPDRPGYLTNLGTGLRSRYERTGVLDDLERAIAIFQQAVDVAPASSPDLPMYLTNLGIGLYNRYGHTRVLDDLEDAIAKLQQAVEIMPAKSPKRPAHLTNLGIGLRNRYECTRVMDDLKRAIAIFQQAVDVAPDDSLDRSMYLTNLGTALGNLYRHTGVLDDLERAIAIFQQAVDATPASSPDRPTYLSNLGNGLRDRYESTRALVDLDKAIKTWEAGWSLLHLRFVALPIVYQLGQQRQILPMAASLVTVYLKRSALHHSNARIDYRRALEVAEGSKSRLLTQLVGRGPLPLPKGLSPEIVACEQRLLSDSTALDTLELTTHNRPATAQERAGSLNRLRQRDANQRKLEDLWDGIARIGPEGIEYVTLRRGDALTWQELAHLAQELGPATALLSFFTTLDQALLFLVRAGWRGPRVGRIPLNRDNWDYLLNRLSREVHHYGPGLRRRETWDQTLHRLLTQMQQHLKGIERLILAPAGNGHLLPWSVLMERVGWRTPTYQPLPLVTLPALSVLPPLRRRPHTPISLALVVGNPKGDLPYAEDEAREVAKLFGTDPLLGSAATKEAVLSHLAEASLIHLATHAYFDPNNPLESGIVLADGNLTAQEVLLHRLHADLLVLSACESGLVGSLGGEELAGLSQAFLQAGIRSLLVSLWQVNDPVTAALMQAFYSARQAGADKALALRQAMTQIQQDSRWTHPYYWGAFVLLGDWN